MLFKVNFFCGGLSFALQTGGQYRGRLTFYQGKKIVSVRIGKIVFRIVGNGSVPTTSQRTIHNRRPNSEFRREFCRLMDSGISRAPMTGSSRFLKAGRKARRSVTRYLAANAPIAIAV
jgi:hypothetical protein